MFVQMIPVAFADGIIIDHTCTDLSRIPDYWIKQALLPNTTDRTLVDIYFKNFHN
jgi:hypothetical protein